MRKATVLIALSAMGAGVLLLGSLAGVSAQPVQPEYGTGYGPGMMPGYAPGMMSNSRLAQTEPLDSPEAAQAAFARYLGVVDNRNVALDEMMQFQWYYYASVKDTGTANGAFELLANPRNGFVSHEFGPATMWNTKYSAMPGWGMMNGLWGQPAVEPSLSPDQAQQLGQQWLDENQPGGTTGAMNAFPGYYTLHITQAGQIAGVLSVKAYTGQVWYHAWLRLFVASIQV
jgi:hypothetical protein